MTVEDSIIEILRSLPSDKQQEILRFAENLIRSEPKPLKSPEGLWSDLNIALNEADISEARQEMWAKFSRNDL